MGSPLFIGPVQVPASSWSQARAATGVRDVLDTPGCASCEQIVEFVST